ncbi:MAG TPA: glycosyltransferase, partial [Vicinamibacterales bacterium]
MSEFLPWRVLHVSADEACPDLEREAGIGGVFMVFWAARIPLGQLSIAAAQLPLSGAQLATMIAPIVAHNVGHQLIDRGFEPPLPIPPEWQIAHAGPQLSRVLAVSRPLESLAQRASAVAVGLGRPSVSVVICTRNRSESLAKCLRSVSQLSPAPEEVLVIDNAPTAGAAREVVDRFPHVRYIVEPKPGLSAARN